VFRPQRTVSAMIRTGLGASPSPTFCGTWPRAPLLTPLSTCNLAVKKCHSPHLPQFHKKSLTCRFRW
jgi:hypothetical protein